MAYKIKFGFYAWGGEIASKGYREHSIQFNELTKACVAIYKINLAINMKVPMTEILKIEKEFLPMNGYIIGPPSLEEIFDIDESIKNGVS